MTQADRDRLVALKKAKKKLITRREAAEELGMSVRQVKRLLFALKKRGDKAVIHGLRGKPSNRKIEAKIEQEAVEILSTPLYKGFGPTLASEYLSQKHGIDGGETFGKGSVPDRGYSGAPADGQARFTAGTEPEASVKDCFHVAAK